MMFTDSVGAELGIGDEIEFSANFQSASAYANRPMPSELRRGTIRHFSTYMSPSIGVDYLVEQSKTKQRRTKQKYTTCTTIVFPHRTTIKLISKAI